MPKGNSPKTSTKKVRNVVAAKVSTAAHRPTHEDVARRAYEIWEAEGRVHGRHEEHWRLAEQQLGLVR